MVVLASLGYAIGGFLIKHRLTQLPAVGTSAMVMAASAVLLAPPALATLPNEAPGLGPIAAVAALGIFGTGIAFVIFFWLIGRVGPARTYVVSYIAPGFAVIYGAALLDEAITVFTLGGLALILAGSWLAAEGRLPGQAPRQEGPSERAQPAPTPTEPVSARLR
jgi:drug/metabolite transporter (DMT)-like permease